MIHPRALAEAIKRAADERYGMVISCTNTNYVRNTLHQIMQEIELAQDLMICVPSLENTIFIVKRSVELD